MTPSFDVAVIGGGIAGVAAALAAQQRGARTCLVRGAPGVTALSAGAWTGPLPPGLGTALAAAGYVLDAADGPLFHERGHLVHCDFAAASHADARAALPATVCGIRGLPHFNARMLAQLWGGEEKPLAYDEIELPETPAAGWTPLSLAAHIEKRTDDFLRRLPSAERLILPPILGIEGHARVLAEFERNGIQVAEALAATPSLPGWRLQRALDQLLATHGISVVSGRAHASDVTDHAVTRVHVGDQIIQAGRFVLATGKFTAGGIAGQGTLRESVFDLPVWIEHLGDVFTEPVALPLTDPVRTEPQPLLEAGVQCNEEQRPVNRSGDVVLTNVFVAGSIRAGRQAAHAGLGHCAQDGWTAGSRAAA